ncbi:MAG: HAD family hydrolase [Desulfobacteraceae bacterium]|nr:HAD family hydrolase [Desulfobacteraceae bacterium]
MNIQKDRITKTYLFDWGDTLMIDFSHARGKMCNWKKVEAVTGAKKTLASISRHSPIYIATNAADSSEKEIELAFERVGLAQYISGYFCKANLGLSKGSPEFYRAIAKQLELIPNQIIMIGDTIDKDITPALQTGMDAVWFNPGASNRQYEKSFKQIKHLCELCI